jgi:hypothetical protein
MRWLGGVVALAAAPIPEAAGGSSRRPAVHLRLVASGARRSLRALAGELYAASLEGRIYRLTP